MEYYNKVFQSGIAWINPAGERVLYDEAAILVSGGTDVCGAAHEMRPRDTEVLCDNCLVVHCIKCLDVQVTNIGLFNRIFCADCREID